MAFGVRNFGDLGRGVAELSPGAAAGRADRHSGVFDAHDAGFRTALRLVFASGAAPYRGWLSHDRQAYDYLPRSVDEFPQPEEFLTILAAAGFRDCRARSQSFGIAQIYIAEKC